MMFLCAVRIFFILMNLKLIDGAPNLSVAPSSISVGGSITFTCKFTSPPTLNIAEIRSTDRGFSCVIEALDGGVCSQGTGQGCVGNTLSCAVDKRTYSLTINSVPGSWNGKTFVCRDAIFNNDDSQEVQITIPADVSLSSTSSNAVINMYVTFMCKLQSLTPYVLLWEKYKNNIIHPLATLNATSCQQINPSFVRRYSYRCEGNKYYLTIPASSMTVEEGGYEWSCRHVPVSGAVISSNRINLSVSEPAITNTLSITMVGDPEKNNNITLICHIPIFNALAKWENDRTTGVVSSCTLSICTPPTSGRYSFAVNSTAISVSISYLQDVDYTIWACSLRDNKVTYTLIMPGAVLTGSQPLSLGQEFTLTCNVRTTSNQSAIIWMRNPPTVIATIISSTCSAFGSFEKNYTYICDQIKHEFNLTIPAVYMTIDQHGSKWRCTEHPSLKASKDYVIILPEALSNLDMSIHGRLLVNETVSLVCTVRSFTHPITVTHSAASRNITACNPDGCVPAESGRYRFTAASGYVNITISPLQEEDSLVWSCIMETVFLPKPESTLALIVIVPFDNVTIQRLGNKNDSIDGQSAFECKTFPASRPSASIEWYIRRLNGIKSKVFSGISTYTAPEGGNQFTKYVTTSTLTYTPTFLDINATITCRGAFKEAEIQLDSKDTKINLLISPMIPDCSSGRMTYEFISNNIFNLTLQIIASPMPSIDLLKEVDGKFNISYRPALDIRKIDWYYIFTFSKINAQESDVGIYHVTASNAHGISICTIVVVKGQKEETSEVSAAVVIGVIVPVLLIAIISAITFVFYRRRIQRSNRSKDTQSTGNAAGPDSSARQGSSAYEDLQVHAVEENINRYSSLQQSTDNEGTIESYADDRTNAYQEIQIHEVEENINRIYSSLRQSTDNEGSMDSNPDNRTYEEPTLIRKDGRNKYVSIVPDTDDLATNSK